MADRDYKAILDSMTIEEKASLCSGETFWLTKAIDRLGVPSVWMSDGPHGLRKEKQNAGVNVMKPAELATCFPTAVTMASSWDRDLLYAEGCALAEEAKALKVTTILGPGVNIKRSPLCGRNFEYFSEDPYLAGVLGSAFVAGVQDNGVGVSLKHYCANNQESLRMSIDTLVDERTMREIYLAAFERIVKEQQPKQIMCSYNRLNGVYLSDNHKMLTDVLRRDWGYRNIVVSDWGAVNDRVAGVSAGLDLEMPGNKGMNDRNILKAIQEGKLTEEELDVCALRMLRFAFECKDNEVEGADQKLDEHHAFVRRAAAEAAVLLKNEDGILPIARDAKIAVIGDLAQNLRYQGAGSSHINPPKTVAFTQALRDAGKPFDFAAGYTQKGDGLKQKLIKEAVETARGKDVVLVFIGLTDAFESEGFDRKHIGIPSSHVLLVEEINKVNPNIVVVLSGGSPIEIGSQLDGAKAILNMYLAGQAGGEAAMDLLYGDVNPSGKLAETYPIANEDAMSAQYFPMGPRSVEYRESVYVGYRYFDTAEKAVKYPFGYGLSYTTFEYSDMRLSADSINEGEELIVSLDVKNTGAVAGAEIVQLYVRDVESTIFRPLQELKEFTKVYLQPGETRTVEFALDSRAFAYYNVAISDWHVESGSFEIRVGASSRDIRLTATVNVTSANPDAPIPDYRAKAPAYYNIAAAKNIPDEQFVAVYGGELVGNAPYKKGDLTINNSIEQVAVNCFGRSLYRLMVFGSKIMAIGTENPEMITQSVKDMPLRSFAGFTGGILSQMTVDGILDKCNGTKGACKKIIAGFKKKNK